MQLPVAFLLLDRHFFWKEFFWKQIRFGIISDLKKCWKDHRKFPYIPHPLSSNVISSRDSSSSVKTSKPTFVVVLLTNLETSVGFHQFSHRALYLLPDLIVDTMLYSTVTYASLLPSHWWQILSVSYFPKTLSVLRSTSQVFCRVSLNLGFFGVSLMTRLWRMFQRSSTLLNA